MSETSRVALRPTQGFCAVERPGREVDHSPSGAEDKNKWSYTSTSPMDRDNLISLHTLDLHKTSDFSAISITMFHSTECSSLFHQKQRGGVLGRTPETTNVWVEILKQVIKLTDCSKTFAT